MSENEATLDNENSAETGTDVDWQKRYTDTQAEYTRQQQALKDEQAVWDDEDAILARIREKHPQMVAEPVDNDEDEDDDNVNFEDDEPRFAKLSPEDQARLEAHDQWIAREAAKNDRAEFNSDLAEEAGDRELTTQAKKAIWTETLDLGGGRENLKKALASWIEYEDGLGEQYMERVKKSKRAPHVQANGQTATGTKPVEDMTREEHTAWMVEQALARGHQ